VDTSTPTSLVGETVHEVPELSAGERVDPGRGLVEEEHARLVEDGTGQREPLAQAQRQRQRLAVGEAGEAEARQQGVDAAGCRGPVQTVEAGRQAQVLADRLVAIEREALRHVPDARPHAGPLAAHVVAGHERGAGRRRLQPAQHLDERRLAGAVGTEQAHDLARAHLEAHLVHGREGPEPTGEPVRAHRRRAPEAAAGSGGHEDVGGRSRPAAGEVMDEDVFEAAPDSTVDGRRELVGGCRRRRWRRCA
jgi:hypothetical protein